MWIFVYFSSSFASKWFLTKGYFSSRSLTLAEDGQSGKNSQNLAKQSQSYFCIFYFLKEKILSQSSKRRNFAGHLALALLFLIGQEHLWGKPDIILTSIAILPLKFLTRFSGHIDLFTFCFICLFLVFPVGYLCHASPQ